MGAFKQKIRIAATIFAWLALIVLGNFSNAFAQAQANAGDLTGVVTDPNGAVVAGATVTANNAAINISRSVTSDEAGQYRIVNLPPAEYQVTIEAATFKKSVFSNVRVIIGQAVNLNTSLELGAVGETVTITGAQTEVVETTRTAVSTTIDQQRIDNLPVNQRDYLSITLTTSSVGRDNGRPIGPAPTSGLNFGGQRGRSNLVQVDGADFTDNAVNAARTTISQEGVQEFQVVTNSFAPEFGRSAGGVVNVVTKRGTNDFHGNVFGFIRDKKIQARNAFAPFKSAFTRTQSGVTLGGPLAKENIFFFVAYEHRQRNESGFFTTNVGQGLTSSVTVPAAQGGQTFNFLTAQQAQFAQGLLLTNPTAGLTYLFLASSGGNTALNGFNPLRSPSNPTGPQIGTTFALTGAPVPLNTVNAAGMPIAFRALNSLQRVFPVTDRTNFFSARIDQNIDKNNQFSIRFGYNPSNISGIQVESQNQALGQNDFSRLGVQKFKDYAAVASLTSTLGNFVNEARFNFGKRRYQFTSENGDAVAYNIADTAFIGRELFSPVRRDENRFQINDNLTYVIGNHTTKFGADFNWVDIPRFEFELNFAGLFNFGSTPASQLITGLPAPCANTTVAPVGCTPQFTSVQSYGLGFPVSYIQGIGDPVGSYNNKPIAFFAQDSWKIFKNLTINYGARYDVEFTEQKAPIGFTDPLSGIVLSASNVLAAQDALNVQQGIPRDKNNIAPRFGFAYDLAGNGKTVIRGAIGLFYDHPLLGIAANSDIADATQQQQTILTAGNPSPTQNLNAAQVFQGTVCVPGAPRTPVCAALPAGQFTTGVASTAQYQFGRQRFNDQTFFGFGPVLPFTLPISKDFKYANATQANVAIERQLDRNTSVEVKYLFVGSHNLPHALDVNAPDTNLQIQNFQRFAGRLPTNTTETIGFTIPVAPPGSAVVGSANCTVVIPGAIANCPGGRVVSPSIANFFRPNAPNYFLTQYLLNLYNSNPSLPVSLPRYTLTDFNAALAGSLRTPGTLSPFGAVDVQASDGNSNYNALSIDLKRRFANNLTFLASYTFSKSIDDSSDLQTQLLPQDNRNFRAERSLSLFDQRHRFVFSGVLAAPEGWRKADNLLYRVFSDFTVAPILEISSGRPFNILTNQDTNNDQSSQTDRPSVDASGNLFVPGAFQTGNLARNLGITHSYSSLDMRISRVVRFNERVRLDLIAEGFNLFNRFNEAAASPNVDAVTLQNERSKDGRYFSRPTAAFDPRQFQFGAKLSF